MLRFSVLQRLTTTTTTNNFITTTTNIALKHRATTITTIVTTATTQQRRFLHSNNNNAATTNNNKSTIITATVKKPQHINNEINNTTVNFTNNNNNNSNNDSNNDNTEYQIPLVDFKDFQNGTTKQQQQIAMKLRKAFTEVGFVYIKNVDGLDSKLINSCLDQASRFFSQPKIEKDKIHSSDKNVKGYYEYTGVAMHESWDEIEAFLMGKECDNPQQLKEAYYATTNVPPAHWRSLPVAQRNRWPTTTEGGENFKKVTLQYWEGCRIASNAILSAIALSVGIQKDFFVSKHTKNDCTMELKKYPPYQPLIEKQGTSNGEVYTPIRVNEHADLSSITLLAQTPDIFYYGIDCLEILTPNHDWVKAKSYPDTILVNAGDVMERWTGSQFLSTRHRVVVTPEAAEQPRYSVVYFCTPDWDAQIKCVPTLLDPKNPPRNEPVLFGDMIPFM